MKKILLVDDVNLLIEIQKKFLANSYVQVFTANDGVEALETARRERPDLIIMDKYMPNMDGLTCCKFLKSDPLLAGIPVIMSTNATRSSEAQEYLDAGCVDILAKPIESKLFLNAIKKHIPDIERRSVRVPLHLDVQMQHNNAVYTVSTEDLSLNGLFANTDIKVSVHDEVRFSIILPDHSVPIDIKTRVVWQRNSAKPGFGAEFMEVVGQGISMLRISELKSFLGACVAGKNIQVM
ncbi:MAG: response regulator [Geobacteraceae bacterium]|nr:response regulator [Geobacteraceae bacterium]